MGLGVRTSICFALTLLALAGCDRVEPVAAPDNVATSVVDAASTNAATATSGFQPLQSHAVKDAMHRALSTGETQRWQDGAFSGYAVPGAAGANGCRAIRYTVDQRPEVPFESITACDASPGTR